MGRDGNGPRYFAPRMAFLHPSFLWALTALAIPIFIHLFQLRRFKRIDFPNVRFLQEVTQQTRSRKKLRHWSVLLSRLLALAALVLAFAQPYMKDASGTVRAGSRAISIYVDDSWSMDGQNADGRLLDQARAGTQDVIMSFSPTDRFQVITNRFEGRQQMLLGRDEALASAGQVEVGAYARPLSQVMERQREALSRSEAPVKQAFLFTDLQRVTTDPENWTNDSTIETVVIPIAANNADNLAIDSVWFDTPVRRLGQNEILHVRLKNHGAQDLRNVPLRLTIDGRQRAMATFGADAGAVIDTAISFINDAVGDHRGSLTIEDRPIAFDNVFHIAYHTAEKLRVLLVSGGDASSDRDIATIFSDDSIHSFSAQPFKQLDLSALARNDLVVLNALPSIPSGLASSVKEFVEGGGSVAIFPALHSDPASYRSALAAYGATFGARDTTTVKVERIDLSSPFYRDVFNSMPSNVDLPLARVRYAITPAPVANVLLRLQSGPAFLSSTPVGRGLAYLAAAPLAPEGGTFARHALFVTSMLRMAELARPMGPLYHIIGAEAVIPLTGVELTGETPPQLRGPDGVIIIPEVRRTPGSVSLVLHDEDLRPGHYAVTASDDTIAMIALDLPRGEGDLSAFTVDALQEVLDQRGLSTIRILEPKGADLSASLETLDPGIKLWKWFILAALCFLAFEIILIRTIR